jgi:hypothetical protein
MHPSQASRRTPRFALSLNARISLTATALVVASLGITSTVNLHVTKRHGRIRHGNGTFT